MLSIHSSSNHCEYIFTLCYVSFNAGHFSACTPSFYSSSIIQRRPLLDVLWTGDTLLTGPVSCNYHKCLKDSIGGPRLSFTWSSVCRIDCPMSSWNMLETKFVFWKAKVTFMKESIVPVWFCLKAKNPWKSVCSGSLYEKWLCNESIAELKKSIM